MKSDDLYASYSLNARENLRGELDEPVSIHLAQLSTGSSGNRCNPSTTPPTLVEKVIPRAPESSY